MDIYARTIFWDPKRVIDQFDSCDDKVGMWQKTKLIICLKIINGPLPSFKLPFILQIRVYYT